MTPGVAARRSAVALALGVVLACGNGREAAPKPAPASIRIDGSNGVMPLVRALAEAWRAGGGSDRVAFGAGMGGSTRIQALLERRIDVALASHGIDEDSLVARGLAVHRIALTPVIFGVHAAVTAPGLSAAQVCAAFGGHAANWQALGGTSVPVRPVVRPESEVDMEVARAGIPCFTGLALAAGVTVVQETADMAAALAATEGAIGVTTATVVQQSNGRIRALALDGVEPSTDAVRAGRYPLTRASYLITQASPEPGVVHFLEFIRSPAGAAVLTANGSVPAP
ncbi:MAG TPA: substrate-binding domain-containing protein [Gemmatimonadaceae bacterium]|nr:substrate-binding domain-containing protein [Gemmatimonadaceae bacterium]